MSGGTADQLLSKKKQNASDHSARATQSFDIGGGSDGA